jgi:hypothetical protein
MMRKLSPGGQVNYPKLMQSLGLRLELGIPNPIAEILTGCPYLTLVQFQ